jgi:transposase
VDDWAIRKGERYGTILADLERRRVADLLPDRTSESLAKWLQEHSGVEVISRDRAEAYAEGSRRGAPQALQVADRFHLVQNRREAVEKEVAGRMTAIRKLLLPTTPSPEDDGPVPLSRRQERTRDESRARRLERWRQVWESRGQDYAKKEIARMAGIDVRTVRTYLKSPTFPERRLRVSPKGPLDSYQPYLKERWKEGCHNALQLWREVKQ